MTLLGPVEGMLHRKLLLPQVEIRCKDTAYYVSRHQVQPVNAWMTSPAANVIIALSETDEFPDHQP